MICRCNSAHRKWDNHENKTPQQRRGDTHVLWLFLGWKRVVAAVVVFFAAFRMSHLRLFFHSTVHPSRGSKEHQWRSNRTISHICWQCCSSVLATTKHIWRDETTSRDTMKKRRRRRRRRCWWLRHRSILRRCSVVVLWNWDRRRRVVGIVVALFMLNDDDDDGWFSR